MKGWCRRRGLAALLVAAGVYSSGGYAAEPNCADATSARGRLISLIAERWNLGVGYAKQVVHSAFDAAQRHGVEPVTVLAVAAKESAFRHLGNPDGGADPRRPFGIMQVAGKWHKEKFDDGIVRVTTMAENIQLGTRALAEYMSIENGNEGRALMRYNGSPARKSYSEAVLRTKRMLNESIGGCAGRV